MSYAEEREYTYAQGCIAIAEYILKHGHITFAEAKRVSGSRCRRRVWRMLREIDGILCVIRVGTGRTLVE